MRLCVYVFFWVHKFAIGPIILWSGDRSAPEPSSKIIIRLANMLILSYEFFFYSLSSI